MWVLVVLLCSSLSLLFLFYSSLFRYWDQRGVKSFKGSPAFDFLKLPAVRRKCKVKRMKRLYDSFRGESVYGRFSFASPVLVVRDLDVAKKVVLRDCSNFNDRNANLRLAFCPVVRKNLFNSSGICWKTSRFRLTPVFASANMSAMFGRIRRTSLRFAEFLKGPATKGEFVSVDKVVYRFNADLVADAVFGVDGNCLKDPESEFLVNSRILADHFFVTDGCSTSLVACVAQLFHPYDVKAAERFFLAAVEAAIDEGRRRSSDKSFVQLLLEARHDESAEWINIQACSFVVLGLRSLTFLLTACLVELARHRDVQSRLREEIHATRRAHELEDLPQSAVQGMTFMDRVVAGEITVQIHLHSVNRQRVRSCPARDFETILIPIVTTRHLPSRLSLLLTLCVYLQRP